MVVCRRSRSRMQYCTIVNVSTPGAKNTNGILMSVFLVAETKITNTTNLVRETGLYTKTTEIENEDLLIW